VVQTLKADRDLLGKDIEVAQLEREIEKLQHSAIVSKEKQNELESSNRALREQLQTLSDGIDKAGGISANSFLNTVEKLGCRIANLEESNNTLSIKIFSSLDISNPGWKTDASVKTTSMDKSLRPRKRAPQCGNPHCCHFGQSVRQLEIGTSNTSARGGVQKSLLVENEAAYYGNSLADATLYHPGRPLRKFLGRDHVVLN